MEVLLTLEDIAQRLKLATRTVRNNYVGKKFPGVKTGKSWLVKETDFNKYIESRIKNENSLPQVNE